MPSRLADPTARPWPRLALVLTAVVLGALALWAGRPAAAAAQAPASVEGVWTVFPEPDNPAARDLVVFAPGGILLTTATPVMLLEAGDAPPFLPAGTSRVFSSQ